MSGYVVYKNITKGMGKLFEYGYSSEFSDGYNIGDIWLDSEAYIAYVVEVRLSAEDARQSAAQMMQSLIDNYWIGKTIDKLGHIYYRVRSDTITSDAEVVEKDLSYDKAARRLKYYQDTQKSYNESLNAKPPEAQINAEVAKRLLEREKEKRLGYWENWYSGSDVGIFIGDIWVDDIITIQYTLTNNKSPIYGYMSEKFDAVTCGTTIVQGQFAIVFKETGYLTTILKNYKKDVSGNITTIEGLLEEKVGTAELAYTAAETGNPLRADKWGYLDTKWGNIIDKGFDIIITYGDVSEQYRGGTIEKLNDVHITSRSIVAEPTGEPIAEMYNFFARTYNEDLPKTIFGKRNEIENIESGLKKTAGRTPAQVANDKLKLENDRKALSNKDKKRDGLWKKLTGWI